MMTVVFRIIFHAKEIRKLAVALGEELGLFIIAVNW